MTNVRVALIQQRCTKETESNFDKTITEIEEAAAQGATLIVLQELHKSLYFCQAENVANFDLAETIPGDTTQKLGTIAKKLNVVIVASLFEKRAAGLYHNTAVVFDCDDSIKGAYRKMHIPDDPGYYEKFYFAPGDTGFIPIDTSVGKLGVLICWDQWFPEAARLMALAGADILIYPTAIGWDPEDSEDEKLKQLDAWITVQRGHAISNGLPLISVNRVGFESAPNSNSGIKFWGNSFVAGPQGEILCQAAKDHEETLMVDWDKTRAENVRRIWPFFRDRRIDAYYDLNKRFIDDN